MRRQERLTRAVAYWQAFPAPIRKVLAASVGAFIFIVGLALLVLPGPGIAVIVLGLAILATEFTWAQCSMHHVKRHGNRVRNTVFRGRKTKNEKRGESNG